MFLYLLTAPYLFHSEWRMAQAGTPTDQPTDEKLGFSIEFQRAIDCYYFVEYYAGCPQHYGISLPYVK